MFLDCSFVFERLPHNPGWYPIQVVKGNEVISIIINYENGRAYSTRNWHQFVDLTEEMVKMISGMEPVPLTQDLEQMSEESVFEQMNLW